MYSDSWGVCDWATWVIVRQSPAPGSEKQGRKHPLSGKKSQWACESPHRSACSHRWECLQLGELSIWGRVADDL